MIDTFRLPNGNEASRLEVGGKTVTVDWGKNGAPKWHGRKVQLQTTQKPTYSQVVQGVLPAEKNSTPLSTELAATEGEPHQCDHCPFDHDFVELQKDLTPTPNWFLGFFVRQ